LILDDVQRAIANLGWRYVSRKGRLGSTFERHQITTGDGKTAGGRSERRSSVASGYVAIADGRNDVPPDHSDDYIASTAKLPMAA
jgi:hypothetical protein